MMPRCLACMQGVTLQGLRKVMTQTLLLGALRLKRAVSATYGRPHAGALPELQSALCLRLPAAIGAASDGVPDLQALALSVQHALLHRLRPDICPGALLLRALDALPLNCSRSPGLRRPVPDSLSAACTGHSMGRKARELVMHMRLRTKRRLNTPLHPLHHN